MTEQDFFKGFGYPDQIVDILNSGTFWDAFMFDLGKKQQILIAFSDHEPLVLGNFNNKDYAIQLLQQIGEWAKSKGYFND